MIIVRPATDALKSAEKLLERAPSSEDVLIMSRVLRALRRDRHRVNGEVEQAALQIMYVERPALQGVKYHRIRKIVPSNDAFLTARKLIDEAVSEKGRSLVDILEELYPKSA